MAANPSATGGGASVENALLSRRSCRLFQKNNKDARVFTTHFLQHRVFRPTIPWPLPNSEPHRGTNSYFRGMELVLSR